MEQGHICQMGSPADIFERPASEFVAHFVGVRNFFTGNIQKNTLCECADFATRGPVFRVVGEHSLDVESVMIRRQDVTLTKDRPTNGPANAFSGTITDIAPTPGGMEVSVDIGVSISSLLVEEARADMRYGQEVWVSFEPSAVRVITPAI